MATLAIKGHPKRGNEVIEILEMLGANRLEYKDTFVGFYYYIECDVIVSSDECPIDAIVFTLEEFLEKFPYKVGDKVQHKGATSCGSIFEVEEMRWEENTIKYTLCLFGCNYKRSTLPAEYLQPYKEEKTFPPYMDYDIKATKEQETMEEPKELLIGFTKDDEGDWILNTHKDYEIKEVDGKFKLIKKKPKYPKTYAECCKIVNASIFVRLVYNLTDGEEYSHDVDNLKIYDNIRRLKICRDAYWKIAGDWKPDWKNSEEKRYCIVNIEGGINLPEKTLTKWILKVTNKILVFPTEEMRDTFYENFKELIEQCKELL